MNEISYRNLHFPSSFIRRAVWLYVRFNLSLRDVEELMAERGIEVSYETVRRWVKRFGPPIARGLRQGRLKAHPQWHLDEMYVATGGGWMYLWRVIDQNGEVLDILVQARRDKHAALKLMRKLLKKHGQGTSDQPDIEGDDKMTDKGITRLLPDGALDGGMKPMGYISPDTVADGIADERGHLFFTNAAGNVNAGVWQCTPCTERISDYPYDQICFVLEGSLTITDESGHTETFGPGNAFTIPRGFNGLWQMTEQYKNFFVTVEPEK